MAQQKSLLDNLLSARRFKLLMDGEVLDPDGAYAALQFLTDVQDGVWSELKDKQPAVDVLRRNLQRAYLEHLKHELTPKEAKAALPIADEGGFGGNQSTDFRAVARFALKNLSTQAASAQQRTQDAITRVHLLDCQREIELILNPKN